jgi:hypothetical protein
MAVLGNMSTSGRRPGALRDAVHTNRVLIEDLPELIAFAWLRDDSPTADISETDWLDIFATARFFSYPPGLHRPTGPITLYRGARPDRGLRMSWSELVTSHSYLVAAMVGSTRRRCMPPPLSRLRYWRTFTAQAKAGQ